MTAQRGNSERGAMNSDHLSQLFPDNDDTGLREFAVAPIEQRRILVGGEVRDWTGPTKSVLSPVMVRGSCSFFLAARISRSTSWTENNLRVNRRRPRRSLNR